MNDDIFQSLPGRPALPVPLRERWQPLRLGLVELFHYDSEEFWFRDGHLLLRGNNGTGKSKVLSLTLPFLFDAQLRSSRIEPDGDASKKMAWNLLLNSYTRRMGYAWIEFGRVAEDGQPRYLTLGAGLSAVAARAHVESWYFMLETPDGAGPRIGRDLWLTNDQRVVLTRERLREAIEGRGQLYDTGVAYRRAVDERLFQLGPRRYDALMDTLIQLRQPQLSKKPDEAGLSHALTESLPPLPPELLSDVAEALNQLEEDRRQLDELKRLARAVERFEQRYRLYAGMLTRRQARAVRQAQTEFDNASQVRNQARAALQSSLADEALAQQAQDESDRALAGLRARQETLQADPVNQDANRLELAEKDTRRRWAAVKTHEADRHQARARHEREAATSREADQRAASAESALSAARTEASAQAEAAGLVATQATNLLATLTALALAELPAAEFEASPRALRGAIAARREQLSVLRRRHAELERAVQVLTQRQEAQRERDAELEDAAARRAGADTAFEVAGESLVDAWTHHAQSLAALRFEADLPLAAMVEWVQLADLDPASVDPMRAALQAAQQRASVRHAGEQVDIDGRRTALNREMDELDAEHARLVDGRDALPPPPWARAAGSRVGLAGAPLWQAVDFQDSLSPDERAGLEAALEASGLLDAWVTPDGSLHTGEQTPWLDSQWVMRAPVARSPLSACLRVDLPSDSHIRADVVAGLLACIACDPLDTGAEAWVATDGRYRLGSLAGTWQKPSAAYIGHAARAAARARRLAEIAERLDGLRADAIALDERAARLAQDRQQAETEWRDAPTDQALRGAQLAAAQAAREVQTARARLAQADTACRDAEQVRHAAQDRLATDAADMRLPIAVDDLPAIESALQAFGDALHQLVQAAQEWRRAQPALLQQRAREADTLAQLESHEERLGAARVEAEEAQAHFDVLRETVGAQVEDLRRQLAQARHAVQQADAARRSAVDTRRLAGEARARAEALDESTDAQLQRRTESRGTSVARLQGFAGSSLLSSALSDLELPDMRQAWTIDPALGLARRIEQLLVQVPEDEASRTRVERQVAEDLQELQRALSALGHQAPAEPTEWGTVVHILFHNRPERPDQLSLRLADDIHQRGELLTAQESAVLENYLQAEIAGEVQRLLRAAEAQVQAINRELHKRPTSTGVRYRLLWQALGEEEGAPVGLAAARQRLLNTTADLWSAEDRRVVGTMLQQRIAAERERADAEPARSGEGGGSLVEQLAQALDYRRWHRFRVERQQDGQWRKLSGPASSGERALGLTVPLFAAISSFYSQGSNPIAPRLMLLDEAFAGIDDAARAHCMALIREFDLDFAITSEREWACYAELPGVSICQLQRREGVDAVFVSRWTWDGRAKRAEEDPDRRFAPA